MIGQLEGDADLLVVAVVPLVQGLVKDGYAALEAAQEADQHLLGGAFAGAAGPEESEDFALFDGEVDAADCFSAAWIGVGEILNGEHQFAPWPGRLGGEWAFWGASGVLLGTGSIWADLCARQWSNTKGYSLSIKA